MEDGEGDESLLLVGELYPRAVLYGGGGALLPPGEQLQDKCVRKSKIRAIDETD